MKEEITNEEMLSYIEGLSEEERDQFFSECFSELAEELDGLFDTKEFTNILKL